MGTVWTGERYWPSIGANTNGVNRRHGRGES